MDNAYGGYFAKWLVERFSDVTDGFFFVVTKITHDPLWGGITIAVIVAFVILILLRRKAAGD